MLVRAPVSPADSGSLNKVTTLSPPAGLMCRSYQGHRGCTTLRQQTIGWGAGPQPRPVHQNPLGFTTRG